MQTHAHPSKENRFYVDSAVTSGQRYQVDLEPNDWGYGDHKCTCKDQENHPGRYCKHIRAVLQRIIAVLPQAIKSTNYERFDLDVTDMTYRPDPGCHDANIEVSTVFYQIVRGFSAFYTVISEPATAQQIIVRSIQDIRADTLRLIFDSAAMCWYIKAKAETLATIDTLERKTVTDLIAPAHWYLAYDRFTDELIETTTTRYMEYQLSRIDTRARDTKIRSIYAQHDQKRANNCAVSPIFGVQII